MVTENVPLNSEEELRKTLSSLQKYITFNFIILAYSRKRFIYQTRQIGLKNKNSLHFQRFSSTFHPKNKDFS